MEQGARQFGWLGLGRIPAQFDLRALGWDLLPLPTDLSSAPYPFLLDDLTRAIAIRSHLVRTRVIVADVADSATRAHLLALRFGEVVPPGLALEELAERTRRLSATLAALPRQRSHGPILLDLLHREGWVGRSRLGLHPREFALLWRLADTPDVPVAPATLLSDIWHLAHRPETNSLAVHVCRLRAKLADAGLPGLLHTSAGGYVLAAVPDLHASESAVARPPFAMQRMDLARIAE